MVDYPMETSNDGFVTRGGKKHERVDNSLSAQLVGLVTHERVITHERKLLITATATALTA